MNDLAVALLSLVIGVVATLAVAHYYFRRTVSKELTVYLQSSAQLFRGVASEVRRQLVIEYKGVAVDHLQEMQFLIANTGERAIRDVIAPLTVTLPDEAFLLDAALLHTNPEERQITLVPAEHLLSFNFPLLNRDEFFVVRLLVRGRVAAEKLRFTLTADDLPPVLTPIWTPPDLVKSDEKRSFEYPLLIGSAFVGAIGWAIAWLVYHTWTILPHTREGFWSFVPDQFVGFLASVFAAVPAIILIVAAVLMFFGAFGDFSFPPRKRFVVPKDILRIRRPLFVEDGAHFRALTDDETPKKG